jgi:hypothetical protein
MDNTALDNLSGPGKALKPEAPDEAELAGLLRTGTARLHDAHNAALSLESQFDLAYNAAHALCLAALRRKGYRPSNRYIVFQVLPTHWALALRFGVCLINVTTRATSASTKACWR